MPFTQVGSLRIHYRTAGEGMPLFLLHGLGNNSQSWSRQLAGLQDHFQVIAWDTPGYGDSSDPDPEFRTFGELAELLKGFIDSLGFRKIFLLGHSMGSTLAMEFCAKYPEYVEALILAASTRGGRTNPETNERKLKNRLHNVENLPPQELAELRTPDMFSPYAAPEIIAEAKRIMSMVRPPGYRSVAYSLYHADQTELLGSIKLPTMLICGEDDKVTPVPESRIVAEKIEGATLHLIPRAGHVCYIEQPEEFNRLVLSFLHKFDKGEA
ncbi:alpha/beta hydrolase [Brevibacillus brevis]|uniref:Alpha/beta hydrolase n=1 Tax=Brevibacillus brevis TaxID=1393 RepID=A0ABY9T3D5_BREBE|nr:alpha/beta hydrolase [Brevibacillus brevis]WNC13731.1 alpha/beta hydrolase [Brevibacillus brevis]